jgi:hypothetical protein
MPEGTSFIGSKTNLQWLERPRNIEKGFALGHENVHFLRDATSSDQKDI